MESGDAVENSVGGHGRVRVGPSFGIDDRQRFGAPFGWRDRLLGGGWQSHHGSSPAGGRQPAMRGLRFNAALLHGLRGLSTIKDYSKRKIRTVFGRVEVRNPRIMNSL